MLIEQKLASLGLELRRGRSRRKADGERRGFNTGGNG